MGDELDSLLAMMGSGKSADSGGARTQDGKQQGKQSAAGKGRKRQRQELSHANRRGAHGAAVASTLPKPSTLWAVKETALAHPQSDTLAILQRLCRRVFKQQAFWKPADRAPTNIFERLADQVFWQHAEAAHRHKAEKRAKAQKQKQRDGSRDGPKRAAVPALDLSRSGTEWWVQVRGPNVEQGTHPSPNFPFARRSFCSHRCKNLLGGAGTSLGFHWDLDYARLVSHAQSLK